jgi:hypothetical protein
MKTSFLLNKIVALVDSSYDADLNHPNDGSSVAISCYNDVYQVWVQIPAEISLQSKFYPNSPELNNNDEFPIHYQYETYFFTQSHTLNSALRKLFKKVKNHLSNL